MPNRIEFDAIKIRKLNRVEFDTVRNMGKGKVVLRAIFQGGRIRPPWKGNEIL